MCLFYFFILLSVQKREKNWLYVCANLFNVLLLGSRCYSDCAFSFFLRPLYLTLDIQSVFVGTFKGSTLETMQKKKTRMEEKDNRMILVGKINNGAFI